MKSPKAPSKSPAKSKAKSPARSSASLPDRDANHRAVLFRPERMRYVRKMIKPKGCVFCEAVKVGVSVESLLLYAGKRAIVIMNKYPYNPGHVLVLPRRHVGEFLELTAKDHLEITWCLQTVMRAMKETSRPPGFNVGLNLGSAAGAGIPEHLHYHVVPRWSGDTNFFPLLAHTKVVVETLEQTYERLLPFFKKGVRAMSFDVKSVDPKLDFDYEFDHVAIACETLEKGFEFYKALGFTNLETEVVPSEKVKTGFIRLGNRANLELLEPTSEDSTVAKFLAKRGPGIHHICLRVKGIDKILEQLKSKGVRLINEQAKIGAHNCRVAFIHPASTGGVLIELSERSELKFDERSEQKPDERPAEEHHSLEEKS